MIPPTAYTPPPPCAPECAPAGGQPGDVHRCEHGSVFAHDRDGWRRLRPIFDRSLYRHATRILDGGTDE